MNEWWDPILHRTICSWFPRLGWMTYFLMGGWLSFGTENLAYAIPAEVTCLTKTLAQQIPLWGCCSMGISLMNGAFANRTSYCSTVNVLFSFLSLPFLCHSSFFSLSLAYFFDSICPFCFIFCPTTPTFSLSHRWSSHAAELPYPELAALPFSGRWEALLLEISS